MVRTWLVAVGIVAALTVGAAAGLAGDRSPPPSTEADIDRLVAEIIEGFDAMERTFVRMSGTYPLGTAAAVTHFDRVASKASTFFVAGLPHDVLDDLATKAADLRDASLAQLFCRTAALAADTNWRAACGGESAEVRRSVEELTLASQALVAAQADDDPGSAYRLTIRRQLLPIDDPFVAAAAFPTWLLSMNYAGPPVAFAPSEVHQAEAAQLFERFEDAGLLQPMGGTGTTVASVNAYATTLCRYDLAHDYSRAILADELMEFGPDSRNDEERARIEMAVEVFCPGQKGNLEEVLALAATPSFGDGELMVGTHIRAGRWAADPALPHRCTWARLADDGTVIEQGGAPLDGDPFVVELEPTDGSVRSDRCGSWTLAS